MRGARVRSRVRGRVFRNLVGGPVDALIGFRITESRVAPFLPCAGTDNLAFVLAVDVPFL